MFLDFIILLGVAIAGGIVTVIGSIFLMGKKILEPNKALQQKINNLESEIENLKKK
ncbi:hypothetical protein [Tuberibacillus calidus]|jgi:hypothetical protein|uniref:hypothetical protein n=1 Tax=Tuberibacillus calidus TaxID=340097 RepID=UPI00040F6486|nr:hypothetical protein [Tuberibacillus calidus]